MINHNMLVSLMLPAAFPKTSQLIFNDTFTFSQKLMFLRIQSRCVMICALVCNMFNHSVNQACRFSSSFSKHGLILKNFTLPCRLTQIIHPCFWENSAFRVVVIAVHALNIVFSSAKSSKKCIKPPWGRL